MSSAPIIQLAKQVIRSWSSMHMSTFRGRRRPTRPTRTTRCSWFAASLCFGMLEKRGVKSAIEQNVLSALLRVPKLRHRARSLEVILAMSGLPKNRDCLASVPQSRSRRGATPSPAPDLAHVTTRRHPLCPTLRRGRNGKAPTLRTSYNAYQPSRATTLAFRGAPYKLGQDYLLTSRLLGTTKLVV